MVKNLLSVHENLLIPPERIGQAMFCWQLLKIFNPDAIAPEAFKNGSERFKNGSERFSGLNH
jgi:hypothetical protein